MSNDSDSLIKQLAQATFARADKEIGRGKWASAWLDARFNPEEGSWTGKARASRPDGGIASLSMGNDSYVPLTYLESQRNMGTGEWYGILVTVKPDQSCAVKLNYDPTCASDSTFYDS